MAAARCIVALVLSVLLAGVFPVAAQSEATESGSSTAAARVADLKLFDQRRHKQLPVRLVYPSAGGPYPLIVFSHGAGGARDDYDYLAQAWAKHGYVVVQPAHEDSIAWNRERGTRFSFIKEMKRIPTDSDGWQNRVRDISFVMDSIAQLEDGNHELKGKIDPHRIGVGGHSYGAFTSLLIGGARLPGQPSQSLTDERVQAVLAVSPQGVKKAPGALGFDSKESFASVHLPVLFLTGDRDGTSWNSPASRQQAFGLVAAGDKYLVTINGANHMTFVGSMHIRGGRFGRMLWDAATSEVMPAAYGDEAEHWRLIEEITTKYWDAYLKREPQELTWLQGSGLADLLKDKGTVKQR